MKKKYWKLILGAVFFFLIFIFGVVFFREKENSYLHFFENQYWNSSEVVAFSISPTEELKGKNIFLEIEYTNNFATQNMHVLIEAQDKKETFLSLKGNILLFDSKNGVPLGEGKFLQKRFKKRIIWSEKIHLATGNNYTIEVSANMREEKINGIISVKVGFIKK